MADLKLTNVSLVSDVGNYDGDVLGMVNFFRERVLTDLIELCETQLVSSEEFGETDSITYDDSYYVENELSEVEPEEELAGVPVENVDTPQLLSDILDTEISTKIGKFQAVISYFDNIIKLNGVVEETITATTIVQKFKELNGVFRVYGEFTLSNSLTIVWGD